MNIAAKKEVISHFKERPKTNIGWWAFGLSLATIFSGPILGISAAVLRPLLDSALGEQIGSTIGLGVVAATFAVLVLALIFSIKAFRRGERSWAVWMALIFSLLEVSFWILMIVGEFVFPH